MKKHSKIPNVSQNYLKKVIFSVMALINILLVVTRLQHLGALIYYFALCLSCIAFVFTISLVDTKSLLYKLAICIDITALATISIYLIAYNSGFIEIILDRQLLRLYIENAGIWGVLVLFLLTLLEVVVLPIPAAITIVIGNYLFGATISFIVSTAGVIVGSAICFILGRYFGRKWVNWLVGVENVDRYSAILSERGKIPFVLMMLFPFFPDDILCLVAGLTNMSFRFFMLAITFTRPIMVAFYAYFGTGDIIPFTGWGIPVWIGLIAVALFIIFVINRVLKKSKRSF